jgi:hypothetical protein
MARQKWSPEVVVQAIKELHTAGSRLDHSYVRKNHRSLLWAANRYIGTWKESIEAAGLNYSSIRLISEATQWSRQRVIEEIIALRQSGQSLNSNYAQTKQQKLYTASLRYFGSWGKAVESAGFDYSQERRVQPFRPGTEERVVADIKARKAAGKHVSGGVVSTEDRGLYAAARRAFPGRKYWEKALQAAGINPDQLSNPKEIWTREVVLETIRARDRNGEPLYSYFLTQNGLGGLTGAGRRIFGSWREAVEAAGLVYEEVRAVRHNYWTESTVIDEIHAYAATGNKLSLKSTQQERADLIGGAIKCFGSWDRAVTAAGFNYREHCKVRSTKFWLNQLRSEAYQEIIRQGRTRRVKTTRVTKRRGTK